MQKLEQLQAHANCSRVRLNTTGQRVGFVRRTPAGTVRCRGLTRVLARSFPVAEHDGSVCARCNGDTKVAEATAKRIAGKKRKAAGYRKSDLNPSAKQIERTMLIVPTDLQPIGSSVVHKCKGVSDRMHGIVVDDELTAYVQQGNRFSPGTVPDPCTLSLLAHLRTELQWEPIAAQVPLYSHVLDIATAADLLCTDVATRTKLFLVEVKATRARSSGTALHACYTAAASTSSGNLRGLPLSRYSQHQLQLWSMAHMVQEACSVPLDGAVVLRTSRARVDAYPLIPWFDERKKALLKRLGAKRPKTSAARNRQFNHVQTCSSRAAKR